MEIAGYICLWVPEHKLLDRSEGEHKVSELNIFINSISKSVFMCIEICVEQSSVVLCLQHSNSTTE